MGLAYVLCVQPNLVGPAQRHPTLCDITRRVAVELHSIHISDLKILLDNGKEIVPNLNYEGTTSY